MKKIHLKGWICKNQFSDKPLERWDRADSFVIYKDRGNEEDYDPGEWPPVEVEVVVEMTEACFDEKPDDIGDIFTLEEFLDCCDAGGFTDYDGFGHPIKDGKQCSHVAICPSERHWSIPQDTTHIIWYNK